MVSHDCGRYAIAQRFWSYGTYAAGEAGRRDRGVEIVTRMSHQMIYLGHPQDALGLLGVAAKKATLPATRALVASQTGRVHAALGDEREADRYLGDADGLLADGLGDDVPEWVSYFDAAEHAGARAVSARDLAGLHHGRRVASGHLDDAARVDSTLVASRLNMLLEAARPYETGAVQDVRTRARDLATARPTTIAA
ncbi:hypothetical protein AB0M58_38630 [Streptomyces bobili]|uniref:hypothetical protein n=1 Tax=Streptomyces bobili TaxID=67280 RepID=UPI0034404839